MYPGKGKLALFTSYMNTHTNMGAIFCLLDTKQLHWGSCVFGSLRKGSSRIVVDERETVTHTLSSQDFILLFFQQIWG